MADKSEGVPENHTEIVDNPEIHVQFETTENSSNNENVRNSSGSLDFDVFENKETASKSTSSSESEEYYTASQDVDYLNVNDEPFRPRSNSEVDTNLEFDIIPSMPTSSTRNKDLPPLIRTAEHDRGNFVLPSIDPNVYPIDEYKKPSEEPGEIFIFNFETYRHGDTKPREGTRLDVRALIETFGKLKFNIPETRIYNDLTKQEVLNTIQAATSSFSDSINCLIVIFLTHGETENKFQTHDKIMSVEDVTSAFDNCDALRGVPKWFTFLACKEGEKSSYSTNPPIKIVSENTLKLVHKSKDINDAEDVEVTDNGEVQSSVNPYKHRLPNDVILYFSTMEGNKSARVKDEGTWVIQELCRNLNAYGRRDEVFTLLTRTNKCVANNYVGDEFRQCPVILSTLRKKFYLTLSKDRVGQLEILSKTKQIIDLIKE